MLTIRLPLHEGAWTQTCGQAQKCAHVKHKQASAPTLEGAETYAREYKSRLVYQIIRTDAHKHADARRCKVGTRASGQM
eukprot:6192762-Pleurochrysis_carterae.AAC.1